jgi:hypothetical protein
MPCNASYARFIFGKFFTSTIILYILLFAQNLYSCKKWVLHGAGGTGSGGAEDSRPGSASAVEKTGLTSGPPVSAVCREKASRTEGVNQRRKRTSTIAPTACMGRAAWASLWASACGRREASGGRLGQRPSGPVRVAEPKVKKKDF